MNDEGVLRSGHLERELAIGFVSFIACCRRAAAVIALEYARFHHLASQTAGSHRPGQYRPWRRTRWSALLAVFVWRTKPLWKESSQKERPGTSLILAVRLKVGIALSSGRMQRLLHVCPDESVRALCMLLRYVLVVCTCIYIYIGLLKSYANAVFVADIDTGIVAGDVEDVR